MTTMPTAQPFLKYSWPKLRNIWIKLLLVLVIVAQRQIDHLVTQTSN